MRKRWLVMGLTALTATSLSMTACGKKDEVQPVDTYTDAMNYENQGYGQDIVESSEDYVETTADITEAVVESSDGLVKISDIKDDALTKSVTQAQNGFKQLCISAGMDNVDVDILHNREALFEALGITEEELLKITTEDELVPYLEEKGLTQEQILCFSIYNYLIQALDYGDESEDESLKNYLTKTKDLLLEHDLDFDIMINTKNFSELISYVENSDLDLEDLNNRLWINSIFPGLDVDATALMNATTPYDFLKVFSETDLTLDQIAEKAAEPDKAAELLTTLNRIEEESIAEESSKNAGKGSSGGSSSGSGSGSGGKTASDVKESIENKEVETIPDKGGANSVTLLVGNDGSSANSNKPNSSDSDKKGNATIKVNDKDEKVRIIVRRIVRGDKAVAEINASNSNLPGMIDAEKIPDDYDWVAVKFTVRRADGDSTGDNNDLVRPLVRVKNMSGANIEDVATRVQYIQPETSAENSDSMTYWVAFMIPEDQANFMLYFGETSGTVYKFKSTALMEDDDD